MPKTDNLNKLKTRKRHLLWDLIIQSIFIFFIVIASILVMLGLLFIDELLAGEDSPGVVVIMFLPFTIIFILLILLFLVQIVGLLFHRFKSKSANPNWKTARLVLLIAFVPTFFIFPGVWNIAYFVLTITDLVETKAEIKLLQTKL